MAARALFDLVLAAGRAVVLLEKLAQPRVALRVLHHLCSHIPLYSPLYGNVQREGLVAWCLSLSPPSPCTHKPNYTVLPIVHSTRLLLRRREIRVLHHLCSISRKRVQTLFLQREAPWYSSRSSRRRVSRSASSHTFQTTISEFRCRA